MLKAIALFLLILNTAHAENKMDGTIDTFKDKVILIKETDEGLKIHFGIHSAVYKLSKKNRNFDKFKIILTQNKNTNKDVLVKAQIPSMEIVDLK